MISKEYNKIDEEKNMNRNKKPFKKRLCNSLKVL